LRPSLDSLLQMKKEGVVPNLPLTSENRIVN